MVVVSLPTAVAPGEVAGYQISIHNRGPSNIAQLYLFAATKLDRPAYQDPLPGCNTTGRFYCALGQLKAGATVSVTVAYTTSGTGTFSVDFEANTTGATSSDGGTSHGDTNPGTGTTSLISSNDFAGRFVNSLAQQTVQNDQSIVAGNVQATKVVVNNQLIPVTVQDGSGRNPSFTCTLATKTFSCPSDLFGEWSSVNVNNGATFSSYFTVTITIDAAQVGKGVTKNNLVVYHQFGASSEELISADCSAGGVPCRSVTTGKLFWVIVIHTYHNGNFRLG